MKFLVKTLLAFLLFVNFQHTNAQTETTQQPQLKRNEGSLDHQFEYVISKSYTYRGNNKVYKNVEYHWLTELKASTLDSLKSINKNLEDTKSIVETQAKEIKDLKANLNTTNETLTTTNQEKDNMALFGLQMSKANYNILMWSIIGGLFALLLFFIYRFNTSNSSTKEAKHKLAEVETEFEDHRRNALEREQKVRRQLQDEINKHKA
ncbi:tRNA (guanine-N1)-methyltransferase [Winogradskyella immobilis]|uniref:tRNA (Guanine-N1)-methyltransferase n=1 Tax=Winogradskyella immobilis TaxID=2816852 RepID=A0ABS8EP21_9FLAO|nr:tRNA (guanine-N1)-methyltransferase [Winogradskyella immobilis]MCC1484772.1 tRNA (guanine-N1)-methyltransferase [Winogradskyella immobilis]MCG0016864.1 tRNA (guanine-N1)-methyltransferase [Winogradskyella immobilis]